MCVCLLSCVWLFAIPWTVAHHALLSMGFSQQGYWSSMPYPTPRGSSQPKDQTHFLQLLHWQVEADSLSLAPPGSEVKWSQSRSVVSDCLRPQGLYSPWSSPGQNTGVRSLFLLQGIFPTQGSNQDLPHCRQVLYQLSCVGNQCHLGSPTEKYRD